MLGRAIVLVREDQLSLAIGRRGQNVRLASKLCGWDIEIMTHEELAESIDRAVTGFSSLEGVEIEVAEKLVDEGFLSYDDLSIIEPDALMEMGNLTEEDAAVIVEQAEGRRRTGRSPGRRSAAAETRAGSDRGATAEAGLTRRRSRRRDWRRSGSRNPATSRKSKAKRKLTSKRPRRPMKSSETDEVEETEAADVALQEVIDRAQSDASPGDASDSADDEQIDAEAGGRKRGKLVLRARLAKRCSLRPNEELTPKWRVTLGGSHLRTRERAEARQQRAGRHLHERRRPRQRVCAGQPDRRRSRARHGSSCKGGGRRRKRPSQRPPPPQRPAEPARSGKMPVIVTAKPGPPKRLEPLRSSGTGGRAGGSRQPIAAATATPRKRPPPRAPTRPPARSPRAVPPARDDYVGPGASRQSARGRRRSKPPHRKSGDGAPASDGHAPGRQARADADEPPSRWRTRRTQSPGAEAGS